MDTDLSLEESIGIFAHHREGNAFYSRFISRKGVNNVGIVIVFFRPFYDDEVIENKYLIYSDGSNTEKGWMEVGKDTLAFKYVSKTEDPEFKEQEFRVITGSRDYLNFTGFNNDRFLSAGKFCSQKTLFS